jgi:acyl-CoA reductase-like NAD-dependent aldehyde dehydrogenase
MKKMILSPFDQSKVGECPWHTGAEAQGFLNEAYSYFKAGSFIPVHQRAEVLRKAADSIKADAAELALLIASEGGKPLVDAKVEVTRAENSLRLAAEEAVRVHGQEIPMTGSAASVGRLAFTTREPIGVVLAISAFNHPLNLIAHQVGPAVAAGCPVLVKPAPETPLSCLRLIQYMHKAGLPQAMAQAVMCDNAVAEGLVKSDKIAFLSFIGSARVGWDLKSKLAPGVRCALEHGGAAPVIVDEEADLEEAVPLLIKGGFYHAGQVCVSVQRIFVHSSRQAELVERLKAGTEKLKVGDPTLPETEVGPLIRARDVERVAAWVNEAIAGGAKLVSGGQPLSASLYAPTILLNPLLESNIMKQEIFGPVVCITTFENLEEAIQIANDVPWSFQGAVFSKNIDRALHAAKRLNAAAVMINDHTAFRVDWMPFGGHKQSGLGVGGIGPSIQELAPEKLIVIKSKSL